MLTITFVIGGINKATGEWEPIAKGQRFAKPNNRSISQAKRRLEELRRRCISTHHTTHNLILLTYSGV